MTIACRLSMQHLYRYIARRPEGDGDLHLEPGIGVLDLIAAQLELTRRAVTGGLR